VGWAVLKEKEKGFERERGGGTDAIVREALSLSVGRKNMQKGRKQNKRAHGDAERLSGGRLKSARRDQACKCLPRGKRKKEGGRYFYKKKGSGGGRVVWLTPLHGKSS